MLTECRTPQQIGEMLAKDLKLAVVDASHCEISCRKDRAARCYHIHIYAEGQALRSTDGPVAPLGSMIRKAAG